MRGALRGPRRPRAGVAGEEGAALAAAAVLRPSPAGPQELGHRSGTPCDASAPLLPLLPHCCQPTTRARRPGDRRVHPAPGRRPALGPRRPVPRCRTRCRRLGPHPRRDARGLRGRRSGGVRHGARCTSAQTRRRPQTGVRWSIVGRRRWERWGGLGPSRQGRDGPAQGPKAARLVCRHAPGKEGEKRPKRGRAVGERAGSSGVKAALGAREGGAAWHRVVRPKQTDRRWRPGLVRPVRRADPVKRSGAREADPHSRYAGAE